MTRIKICGLTNLTDAECAVNHGADMLGFIFYAKSPRYINPVVVRSLLDGLGERRSKITAIGVFVNTAPQTITDILKQTGLDIAQLSGDETPDDVLALEGRAYKVVRNAEQAKQFYESGMLQATAFSTPGLLLDADHPMLYGGSGMRVDHSIASLIAQKCRLLLAGGLKPENVISALSVVHPWGVDVASGVEASPGRKDHAKVMQFIQAVREFDKDQR